MARIPRILATGVAAVVLSTPAIGLAQIQRADPAELARTARLAADRAAGRRRAALANQLRPLYRFELMHARTACRLSTDELREIFREADAAYEAAIARLEAARDRARYAIRGAEPDDRAAIRDVVLAVVWRHVAPERLDALRSDLRLRQAALKKAGAEMLVAVLDRELLLTERQRRQVTDALSAAWDDRWCNAVEVSAGGQVVVPDIPERPLALYLSATQRTTWSHLARLSGPLGGVSVDGGGLEIERVLGADLPPRLLPGAPRPVGQQPVIIRAPAPVRLAVRPAIGFDPGPQVVVGDDADDPDPDGPDAAVLRRLRELEARQKQRIAVFRQQNFDRTVFGVVRGEEDFRGRREIELTRRVDHLCRAVGLGARQARKLQAAGQGDLKRFFDHVDEARRALPATDDLRTLATEVARAGRPLAVERMALESGDGPIFAKTLRATLSDQQRAALEKDARDRRVFRHHAAVRWTAVLLTRRLGLLDDRRRRLEAMLLEETRPPLRYGDQTLDYWIVMYQAARIPEARLRAICDDLQWQALARELAVARSWKLRLQSGGFLPREILDSHQDAATTIHVLRWQDTKNDR